MIRFGPGVPVPPAFRLGEVIGTTVRMSVSCALLGGALVWGLLGESAVCAALLVLAALAGQPMTSRARKARQGGLVRGARLRARRPTLTRWSAPRRSRGERVTVPQNLPGGM